MMMEDNQQKTDQIAYHFYTKLFSLVHDARVTVDPHSLRYDKWVSQNFNLNHVVCSLLSSSSISSRLTATSSREMLKNYTNPYQDRDLHHLSLRWCFASLNSLQIKLWYTFPLPLLPCDNPLSLHRTS